uniref:Putative pogo transposable element n=1 Tax=Ixodes ricinus TaxID=34613 RepID=A0A6B0UZR7_IXORI
MVDWITTVWGLRPRALLLPSLLVLDSFRGHLIDSVRRKLKELRTKIAVTPGGPTSVLQPLDVSLNKPFKDNVRRLYTEWMAAGNYVLTPGGKIKRPSIEMLCEWILEAWKMIPAEIIVKSFKKTGISNRLDGTEDHLLCDHDDNDAASNIEDATIVRSRSLPTRSEVKVKRNNKLKA